MTFSRRKFLAVSGAAALGTALSACTPRATSGSGGAGGAAGGTTVRATWWGGDVRSGKFNQIYDAFTAKNSGINVLREPVANFNSYFEKLTVQFTGGNAPDIVHFTERQVADYAGKGQLQDLRKVEGLDLSTFSEAALQAGTYKDTLVMLLIGGTIPATMYNKTLFDKAGVTPPAADWKWDTFVETCRQLKQNLPEGTVGSTFQAVAAAIFDTVLNQDGKSLFAPDFSPELNFSAADAEEWFTRWKDLADEGLCQSAEQAAEETSAPFEDTMFAKGTAVMHVQNSNQLVTYQTSVGSGSDLELAAFPQIGAKPVALVLGSFAAINAGSKVLPEAGEVQQFFGNDPEANKIFGLELGVPGNSNWVEAIQDSVAGPDAKVLAFSEQVQDISVPAQIRPPGGSQAETLMNQFALAVGFGRQTPAAAAAEFVDQLAGAVKAGS